MKLRDLASIPVLAAAVFAEGCCSVEHLPPRPPTEPTWHLLFMNPEPTGPKVLRALASPSVVVSSGSLAFEGEVRCRLEVSRWAAYSVEKSYPNCWPILGSFGMFNHTVVGIVIDPQGRPSHAGVADESIDNGYTAEDIPDSIRHDLSGEYLDVSFQGQKDCLVVWTIRAVKGAEGKAWVSPAGHFRVNLPKQVVRDASDLQVEKVHIELSIESNDDTVIPEASSFDVDRQEFVKAAP